MIHELLRSTGRTIVASKRCNYFVTALTGLCCLTTSAQMKAPPDWVNYEQVLGVKNNQLHYDYDVAIIRSSTTANVLWPGEQPVYTLQLVNHLAEPIQAKGKIDIIHYGTRGRPNDIWLPEMVKLADLASLTVTVNVAAGGYSNLDIKPVIPADFGGYALVMDLGPHGRRLVTSAVRTFSASTKPIQFPKQSLDDMGPDFLYRLGIQAIRMGVDYTPTTDKDYSKKMAELDTRLKQYKEKNITVLLMFGAGAAEMPLGRPRSLLDSNNVMRKTRQDYVWLPSEDTDFKKFVHNLCVQHGWPRGPVTAVSLWNEPWEGVSIAGWQSDILRYREIYTVMAAAVLEARKKDVQVLVGGGDSNSNAWDKLFADGRMTFLPVFDFCSIHYQGMESPSIYPEWVNRRSPNGRVKIWDTESWVGNTDDRIGLTVATNRSTGYDRSMGIYAGYLYTGGRGAERFKQRVVTDTGTKEIERIPETWSPAVAVAAVQHFLGERGFKQLLFPKGLPWVMLFNGLRGNEEDGTAVVCGDIGELFGVDRMLFRGVRGLKEIAEKEQARKLLAGSMPTQKQKDSLNTILKTYQPLSGGQMLLPNNVHFRLYDFYGNPIAPTNNQIRVPLNAQGYYLRTDGSKGAFAKLVQSLRNARIDGYEPVEIVAKDMTARITEKPVMCLQLTNILNRPVKGSLQVSLGDLQTEAPSTISLAPHQVMTIPVKIIGGKPAINNTYALKVHFDAGADGLAVHYEDMHVNLISHLSVTVDGKLDEWKDALPQTVSSKGTEGVSLTEAAWYPFKNFDTRAEGYANGYMAYDDHHFYFAAKVADNTPHPGTYRFEQRPDDEFFYPDTSYVMDMNKTLVAKERFVDLQPGDDWALPQPGGNGRIMHYWESGDNTNSFGVDLSLPQDQLTRVALYLPNIRVSGLLIEISDATTGKMLLRRNINNLWNGAYEIFDLSGKVRIAIHGYGWWYNAKLAALFFDKTDATAASATALFVKEDQDTKGNWKGVYGEDGYYIVGATPRLPDGVSVKQVFLEEKIPLVWPAGVRHYTYRKNPVTPDNSGLGFTYDNVLLGFNVLPEGRDGMLANPPGTMPRYTGYKCTDYEYALNLVAPQYGGGTEIWRLLVPGMNRKHFFPRQPKSEGEGPVKNGQLAIKREGNTLITECAIPWSELPDVKRALDEGRNIKVSFRVNDNGAPGSCMELAKERSVSKQNARAFHPDWKTHWANEVEFSFEKK